MSGDRKNQSRAAIDSGYPTSVQDRMHSVNNSDRIESCREAHDFTGYLKKSEPVEFVIDPALRKEQRVMVRPGAPSGNEIARRAKDIGIGSSTLIRMWCSNRLAEERKVS